MEAHLCKCNNCGTILIDQNPDADAKTYPVTLIPTNIQLTGEYYNTSFGEAVDMQYMPGLIDLTPEQQKEVDEGLIWGCPVCMTDAYLMDV